MRACVRARVCVQGNSGGGGTFMILHSKVEDPRFAVLFAVFSSLYC